MEGKRLSVEMLASPLARDEYPPAVETVKGWAKWSKDYEDRLGSLGAALDDIAEKAATHTKDGKRGGVHIYTTDGGELKSFVLDCDVPPTIDEKWKDHPNAEIMGNGFTCSRCLANYNRLFRYCPDCGQYHDRDMAPGFETTRIHMIWRKTAPAIGNGFVMVSPPGQVTGSDFNKREYKRLMASRDPTPFRTGRQALHEGDVEDRGKKFFCPGCGRHVMRELRTGDREAACTYYEGDTPAELGAAIRRLDLTDTERAIMRTYYDPEAPG